MRPRLLARTAAAALAAALLGGCATVGRVLGGYRDAHAPPGALGGDAWLRAALERGSYDSALVRLTTGRDAPADPLLGALYAGTVAHYGGRLDASARALGAASALAEDRYTKSLTRGGLALLTSDLVLPYAAGRTERLLVHYYGVVGFLRRDSVAAAAVEARRLTRLLEQYRDDRAPAEAATHALLHYVAAVAFEAAGERTDAAVAYRNAAALSRDSTLAAPVGRARRAAPHAARRGRAAPPTGEVVVVLEQGFIGRRVEHAGTFGFDSTEVARLAAADTAAAAALARRLGGAADPGAPVVLAAVDRPAARPDHAATPGSLPLPGPADTRPSAPVVPVGVAGPVRTGYRLRVAWPTFVRERPPAPPVGVVADSTRVAAGFGFRADLSDAAERDLERQRAALIARSAARAAAKAWATRAARKSGGRFGGAVVNVATTLLERADTRSWHLLPGTVGVTRLTLPVGVHRVAVEVPGTAGAPARVELGEVTVREGGVALLSARLWGAGLPRSLAATARGTI